MCLYLIISGLLAFFTTLFATPYFINVLKLEGIVGIDIMKKNKPKIPEMGAPPVIFGFIVGVFAYIFAQQYITHAINERDLLYFMGAITSIIILAFVTSLDELTTLMKKREGKKGLEKYKRIGLKQYSQVVLMVLASLPLVAIGAGIHMLHIPFVGNVEIGILYPLVIIPIAVIGASNATNMLAGFNGLTAGLGVVSLSILGVYAYLNGTISAAAISFIFVATLIGFLKYNWYPAKIFPGGLDYLIGGVIAIVAIIGNIEKLALLIFVPWFVELFLKARSKFKAENFGIIQKDGTLKAPYKKTYSLTHVVMKLGKFKEWQVTLILVAAIGIWQLAVLLVMIL